MNPTLRHDVMLELIQAASADAADYMMLTGEDADRLLTKYRNRMLAKTSEAIDCLNSIKPLEFQTGYNDYLSHGSCEASLTEITGQDSGLVVYENDTCLIVNWAGLDESQLPKVFCGEIVGWDSDLTILDCGTGAIEDALHGRDPDIIYCEDGASVYGKTPCKWWEFKDALVIAPDGWA